MHRAHMLSPQVSRSERKNCSHFMTFGIITEMVPIHIHSPFLISHRYYCCSQAGSFWIRNALHLPSKCLSSKQKNRWKSYARTKQNANFTCHVIDELHATRAHTVHSKNSTAFLLRKYLDAIFIVCNELEIRWFPTETPHFYVSTHENITFQHSKYNKKFIDRMVYSWCLSSDVSE